jgi:hypothetical protein
MRARIALILLTLFTLTATALAQEAPDQTFEGELTTAELSATFEVELEAGQFVTLTTASDDGLDTVLALNNPAGETVAENDDADGVLTSRITYYIPTSGTYTAVVTGYDGATGTFSLTVSYGLDFGLSDAATILVEETVSLDATTTEAKFQVDLEAGDILVASTFALTEDMDTTLTLMDSGGILLAENDDRGDGSYNSQIIYEALEAMRYVVIVSTYSGSGEGDTLLSLATDPNAEPPFNFASIQGEPIAEYTGSLDDEQNTLEYPVELAAGQTLLALANATSGDLDTVLTLHDPDGFPVAKNDDRGDGTLNSAVAYTAPSAGTYSLVLERFPRSTTSGDFQLLLSSVDASVVDTITALLANAITLSGAEEMIETTNFRVYYTLEGGDATTPDYAQAVANTLEEIYDVQVNQIGWAQPVRNEDGFYHAYVADTIGQGGAMGYAKTVLIVFDNPNTPDVRESSAGSAVFVIDNDFADIDKDAPPDSLMRATVTHEFNHVIQFGYDTEEGLDWVYESTASWTETVTVGNDQDATDYVTDEFTYPELCWTTTEQDGYLDYGQWTLLQSLADQYGEGIVVRLWENSVVHDGFETMEQTLVNVDTTIPDVIRRWRVQNFARDYDLAPLFERAVWLEETINAEGEWTFTGSGIQELAANYFALDLNGSFEFALDGADSLELLVLGVGDGEVQAIPLGRAGVFDSTGYDYAALMVFNSAMPSEPGACSYVDYSIMVTEGAGEVPAPLYSFSAAEFEPLS